MRIASGLLVKWYEWKILADHLISLDHALHNYDGEVLIDIVVDIDQSLEKCNSNIHEITDEIYKILQPFKNLPNFNISLRNQGIYSIADYRYDFNEKYSKMVDVLFWDETDAILPSCTFSRIHNLHQNVYRYTPNYVGFFAGAVMWDKSWEPLTFSKFVGKPFIEGDTTNNWSLRYVMSHAELEDLNQDSMGLVTRVTPMVFNGCGLIISSDIVKKGFNVPKDYTFFINEDTGFKIVLQNSRLPIVQYVFKDTLLVHNRKHPDKRSNIEGEEHIENRGDLGALRATHDWYSVARDFSMENLMNINNPQYILKGWQDVF